ncbi:MAG: SDR family NAD(P)-dependent oxidoreductase [Rhodospirillaceae bacterium]|nr:SDR family NAD(P)-dependent oxidoreductase [Rhodospirillaceae bacterium]
MIFNRPPTAEEITEGIDLSGKSVVITGVNSGLGAETMRVLSLRGAHVYGLARTLEKAREACAAVPGNTTALECELGDWQSVRECAESIKAAGQPIDVLIANAGIMAPKELVLHHGLEAQFAINHMGHFVLVHHLLEQVRRAEGGRIVLVSSDAHKVLAASKAGIEFDTLDGLRGNRPWRFYGQSKLANVLHAKALAARLEGGIATANALNPGVIRTGLGREAGFANSVAYFLSRPISFTIPQGAATICYVATSPELEGANGQYFSKCRPGRYNRLADNVELVERLWSWSEETAREYIE